MNEPKISVVIPIYNAEKFIRQCLISVLSSKFKDYEVLVVDDCSTDNSVAEVEKLLPYFDGRLKILSTEKNSGGAGVPRNVGIKNAAGKYVTSIDNDDMILPTALGNFFDAAENFNADVVHTVKAYVFHDTGKKTFSHADLQLQSDSSDDFSTAPRLETEDLRERMKDYVNGKYFWLPWGKLFRRKFLVENKIAFPQVRFFEDIIFCFKCLCLAKNYLRVPCVNNIHRRRDVSAGRNYNLLTCLRITTKIVSNFEDFMSTQEFFRRDLEMRHAVLKFVIDESFNGIKALSEAEPHEVYELFHDYLCRSELDAQGKDIIAAYLYAERVLTR